MQKNLTMLKVTEFDNKIQKSNKIYLGQISNKRYFKKNVLFFGTEQNILEFIPPSTKIFLNTYIGNNYLANNNLNGNKVFISPCKLWSDNTFEYLKANYEIREFDLQQISVLINSKKLTKNSKNLVQEIFNFYNTDLDLLNSNFNKPLLIIFYYDNWLKTKKDYIFPNGVVNGIIHSFLNHISNLDKKFKIIYGGIENIGRIDFSIFNNLQHIIINQNMTNLANIGYGIEEIFLEKNIIKIIKNHNKNNYTESFSEKDYLTLKYYCDKIGIELTISDLNTNIKNLSLIFNKEDVFFLERL